MPNQWPFTGLHNDRLCKGGRGKGWGDLRLRATPQTGKNRGPGQAWIQAIEFAKRRQESGAPYTITPIWLIPLAGSLASLSPIKTPLLAL